MLFGFLGFYLLAGFIALSFGVGLLMKFGVLRTPGVVKTIAGWIGKMTWYVAEYVGGILMHLAMNPLDLLFTVLAGFLIGLFLLQASQSERAQPSNSPEKLPIRGASIQSLRVIERQLAERRHRAQAQLNEQYAKHTVQ